MMTPEKLSDRLWDFSARVGVVVDALPDTHLGHHVASQLVRCGTAAAPNYDEGRAAGSGTEFVGRLSAALKELRESHGWLRFIVRARLLPEPDILSLQNECEELINILGQAQQTASNLAPARRPSTRAAAPA